MSDLNLVNVAIAVVALVALYVIFNGEKKEKKSAAKTAAAGPQKVAPPKDGKYTREEVAKHNSRESLWIIVDKNVYDVTEYIDEHPGGDSILANAGGDNTVGVKGPQHPISMWDVLALYKIGELVE